MCVCVCATSRHGGVESVGARCSGVGGDEATEKQVNAGDVRLCMRSQTYQSIPPTSKEPLHRILKDGLACIGVGG